MREVLKGDHMRRGNEFIQVQVGAFVAVGLLLFMMVIFMLGGEKKLFDRQYHLKARFSNISGLRVGAPVQLAGINVGTVSKVDFDPQLADKDVRIVASISKRYRDRIRADSVASIITQGLLGDKMVLISVGSSDSKLLEEGDELQASSPTDFSSLMKGGDALVESLNKVSENLQDITGRVKTGEGFAHEIIYSPEGKKMLEHMIAVSENLNEITAKINHGEGTIGALVNDASVFNDIKTLFGKANRNVLIKAVIRETLRTKDEKLLK
jgi:phospholipid/cholesterol/gamma-HCH transport system substrate-binding protein